MSLLPVTQKIVETLRVFPFDIYDIVARSIEKEETSLGVVPVRKFTLVRQAKETLKNSQVSLGCEVQH